MSKVDIQQAALSSFIFPTNFITIHFRIEHNRLHAELDSYTREIAMVMAAQPMGQKASNLQMTEVGFLLYLFIT